MQFQLFGRDLLEDQVKRLTMVDRGNLQECIGRAKSLMAFTDNIITDKGSIDE